MRYAGLIALPLALVLASASVVTPGPTTSALPSSAPPPSTGAIVASPTTTRANPTPAGSVPAQSITTRSTTDGMVVTSVGGTLHGTKDTGTSRRALESDIQETLEWPGSVLDGFGELFRMMSFEAIGAAAMMSRACAGLVAGRIIVALPGSEAAVRLAMDRLLIPELGHLVQQASR